MRDRGTFDFTVMANTPLCREHFRLTLRTPTFPKTSPGQFVQVLCDRSDGDTHAFDEEETGLAARDQGDATEWSPSAFPRLTPDNSATTAAMLRRPFSLAGRRDVAGGVEIDLIARAIGVGTRYLSALQAGDGVNVLGPLGNAFVLPPPGGVALLVGGGVGIPPMLYLAEALATAQAAAGRDSPRAVAFCGAMSRDLVPLTILHDIAAGRGGPASDSFAPRYDVDEFARHGIPAVLSTDDGSYGYRGLVTDTLQRYLDAYLTDNADRARAVIYTCGPEGMLKAVADVAGRRGIACQVCVERAMACGLGTCQSCVIKVQKPDPAAPPLAGSDWCYRLACTDGPVFEATSLLW